MIDPADYLIDDDEDIADGETSDGRLVVPLGAAKSTGLVPLAFTIAEDLQPIRVDGLAIAWTREAAAAFSKVRESTKVKVPGFERNLPYASLRGLMEVTLPKVARIERGMGLDAYALDLARKDPVPFAYIENAGVDEARDSLRPVLDDWIAHFLAPQYLEPGEVPQRLRDRVRELAQSDGLLSIEEIHARLLPWNAGPTGTAAPPDKRGFQLLVDQAARLVAGKELFRGLGPMRRIVTVRPGAQSVAELITDPIDMGERGMFSLVVMLEVVTFPSLGQPLLTVHVSKRLWLMRLSDRTRDFRAIGGTVFSSKRPDRAVSFQVRRKKLDNGVWRWMPDNAFEAVKRELSLPLRSMDGHEIASGAASTADSRVLLVHRDTVSEGRHGIKRGVPEVDKLEAFQALAAELASMGITPFEGYTKLKPRHGNDHERLSRMINAPTLIGAALEVLETGSAEGLSREFLKTLDDKAVDQLLRRQFKIGLDKIQKGSRIVRFQNAWGQEERDQSLDLDELIAANREAIERLYPGVRPLLVIFHEDGADTQLRILKSVVKLLWGDALEIMSNRLPAEVHGPKLSLPGKDLGDAARTDLRVQAWRPLAVQIAQKERRVFCLVMARNRYREDANVSRSDDRVNKPAARQALAMFGGANVQYLLPPNTSPDTGTIDIVNFLHRAQAAMKDLISAHSGRIEGVREAVEKCFGDTDETRASMPREIIGITIVRKNSGRSRGNIGTTFLPIAVRIDVERGRCEMCCAYEGSAGLTMTRWEPFSEALVTVSRVSPVRLAERRDIARTRFMDFVERIVSASVEDGARPVVMIDSSNCVFLWPWLADQKLDVSKIEIGQRQWMQDEWKGARIIRIRQDLAPGIVEAKEQHLAFTSMDDARPKDRLAAGIKVEVPSSPVGLFRLDSTRGKSGCVCYLSVGRKTLMMNKRGPSCYRETEAAIPQRSSGSAADRAERVRNAAGLALSGIVQRPPWLGQWPTPNPLEIVVTLRHDGDDPDRLAELVERLRYGFGHYAEWTALPAPLFFERVVRDYISSFALDNAVEDEMEDEQADSV